MDKEHIRRHIFKYLKRSKLLFNTIEWITGYKDIRIQKTIHANDIKKNPDLIKKEIKLVQQYWHCGSFHYWRYGLPYMALSDEEILNYVPTYYHHVKLEHDHEGIDTVYYGDKLNQALLFQKRDIPTGEVLAFYDGKKWFDFTNKNEIDVCSLIDKSLKQDKGKLFIKPTGGQGGFGIYALKYQDEHFVVNGEIRNLHDFILHLPHTTFILQKGLIQSKQMMEINPSSVNTLRVVVQKEGQQMKMKTCIIRMGRQGKEVDNSAQGGISVKVDIETGNVAQTATAEHGGGILTCHPDTNKVFKDITINNWEQLKGEIEEIGTKLIDFRNIALDIAVTEEGAKLLEFNFRYGIEHQQCVLGGVRKVLNIYPD